MGRKYTRKRGLGRTRRSAAGGREARDELVVLYLAGLDEAERLVKVAGGRVASSGLGFSIFSSDGRPLKR